MDKNAIKKYAVWARRELISRVTQKALQYGITEKEIQPADAFSVNGVVLSAKEKKQRQALIAKINAEGFEQVMEEVAYTWFNRFSALRFMEVNGYLPTHVRVFTDEENNFKPQILAEAINLEIEGLDMEKVYALKDANDNDALFKYLIITQCNALSAILPGMFQKIDDYTELLFPDNLLREGSAIEQMIAMIPEVDWNVEIGGQIEIIGWLYQYYISEKHKEVVDPLHGKVTQKSDVPAATQLFTTDWVVRYLIENSVGRYWIERNPESALSDKLDFYIESKKEREKCFSKRIKPEQVTVFDPCMGSAHFGVYAFDVLVKIYEEYGYTDREAATLILQNNLYGVDIDDRAAQLAYFAIMMKARQYDRRFFSRDIQPHFYSIPESNEVDDYVIEYFSNENEKLKRDITSIIDDFKDAKEYGSIIHVRPVNFASLFSRIKEIENDINICRDVTLAELDQLLKVAYIMSGKYAVLATNPPYLNKYAPELKKYVTREYKDYSGDLFSVFMRRNFDYCIKGGYSCFMTPNVWMFNTKYEKLRSFIIDGHEISSLIQMAKGAFYKDATVDVCAFVLKNDSDGKKGCYFRLEDFKGGMDVQMEYVLRGIADENCPYFYEVNSDKFADISGTPIAYWANDRILNAFQTMPQLSEVSELKHGISTSDNDRYLRLWHEVESGHVNYSAESKEDTFGVKWFPILKGGEYRKWYGNHYYIVNWENDGEEIKFVSNKKYPYLNGNLDFVLGGQKYFFREGLTWSSISSGNAGFRYYPAGFMFTNKGQTLFSAEEKNQEYFLAFLNTKVVKILLEILAPTIGFELGYISKLPIQIVEGKEFDQVITVARENISISRADWDSYEYSWDFSLHPLVSLARDKQEQLNSQFADCRMGNNRKLTWHFDNWLRECTDRFNTLKANEEKLNSIFIGIYGLQDELTPEVEDKDVTVRKADLQRDIKSLISYAVGCMFGRYSLDVPSLAFAGGDWDASKYTSFPADKDNIIPICNDGDYFEDDIVGRFVKFIEVVYGKESLDENLKFIADALGSKGQPKDVIRNYFLNDFYADHCKIYHKRPIYWQFDSGKKNGFKCLIYMHRYQPDTIARIRTDYVHEQQGRYRTAITDLEKRMEGASTSERVKLSKQLGTLKAQAAELHDYEEKIHHLADQYISIDLDDGVKVNYAKFQDVLAKIK